MMWGRDQSVSAFTLMMARQACLHHGQRGQLQHTAGSGIKEPVFPCAATGDRQGWFLTSLDFRASSSRPRIAMGPWGRVSFPIPCHCMVSKGQGSWGQFCSSHILMAFSQGVRGTIQLKSKGFAELATAIISTSKKAAHPLWKDDPIQHRGLPPHRGTHQEPFLSMNFLFVCFSIEKEQMIFYCLNYHMAFLF